METRARRRSVRDCMGSGSSNMVSFQSSKYRMASDHVVVASETELQRCVAIGIILNHWQVKS